MSYRALYRRFRPETFDNLVGQENVVTILKNQIKTDNIAHAYLFSGIRGTGKTSAAKIFARAVNCLQPIDGNPCNVCEICRGILDENIMDVVELDAASNNKVEDIRELKENSNYPPSKAKYKVYIVDEVHMLSKGAFNAFLKTLEEPPSYVIFILATTEEQRLPATILSRCQRFEFKRIPNEIIIKNLGKICKEIGVEAEDAALSLIARNSEGAMRDALSILDQCLSNTEGYLSEKDVMESIGSVDTKLLRDISEYIIDKNTVGVVGLFDKIMQSGKDLKIFLKELTVYFRNLMIVKSGANFREYIELSDDSISELEEISKKLSMNDIVNYIEILNDAEQKMKFSTQPRTMVELSLIKLSEQDKIEDLMARIEALEKKIISGDFKTERPVKSEYKTEQKKKETSEIKTEEKVKKVEYNQVKTDLTFDDILKGWQECMDSLRRAKPATHALIMEGKPTGYVDGQIEVSFGPMFGFHKEAVELSQNKDYIEEYISNFYKSRLSIRTKMDGEELAYKESGASKKEIEDAVEFFGKDIVEIK